MRAFYLSTKPLVDLFNAMGNLLLKPFGVPPASEAGHQPHSEDELRELLRESWREGLIDREEQELSEAALVFGDMRAREVMKPRGEIDLVFTTDSPPESPSTRSPPGVRGCPSAAPIAASSRPWASSTPSICSR